MSSAKPKQKVYRYTIARWCRAGRWTDDGEELQTYIAGELVTIYPQYRKPAPVDALPAHIMQQPTTPIVDTDEIKRLIESERDK